MRRSTFCIGVSKPFGCNETSVGRHTQKPKPEGLRAVTCGPLGYLLQCKSYPGD